MAYAMALRILDRSEVADDMRLRLEAAVAGAYPLGDMTVNGLRTERARGRFIIERTAGKDFTTLADMEKPASSELGGQSEALLRSAC